MEKKKEEKADYIWSQKTWNSGASDEFRLVFDKDIRKYVREVLGIDLKDVTESETD